MDATISVICFKSKTLANGEHPLMLRITKDRKRTTTSPTQKRLDGAFLRIHSEPVRNQKHYNLSI